MIPEFLFFLMEGVHEGTDRDMLRMCKKMQTDRTITVLF